MTLPTYTLKNGQKVKLGRLRPKALPAVPKLAAYLTGKMKTPPPVNVDYAAKAMAAVKKMYGNDVWGDCVIAGKLHQLGIWSGNDKDSGGLVLATDKEAVDQYHQICGRGDPGCYIAGVLDFMRAKGLKAGGKTYKLDGYVAVDPTNKLEIQVALYLFGSLTLGIDLPEDWFDADDNGIWDITDSRIVGGHDVCGIGYGEKGLVIATWGGLRTITWAALSSGRWVSELYVQLAPLWYNNDKLAPNGVNVSQLQADLAKLGGGVIPDIDPPQPPPPPTPPGAAVTFPGDVKAGSYTLVPAGKLDADALAKINAMQIFQAVMLVLTTLSKGSLTIDDVQQLVLQLAAIFGWPLPTPPAAVNGTPAKAAV